MHIKTFLQRGELLRIGCAVLALLLLATSAASALSDAQLKAYTNGTYYFNTENDPTCANTSLDSTAGSVSTNASQAKIAQTIIGIAKTDNLGKRGALIGLMVGLAESGLKIYSNKNVTVSLSNPAAQAVGSDHDSVGVFQQRPSTGWSTIATGQAALTNKDAVWQLMDPAYSAEAFFGSPKGSNAPPALSKGLQDVTGWQTIDPWVAAQDVQASGTSDGSNYKAKLAQAQNLVDQYWDDAQAVPLPVPFTGGSSAGGTDSTGSSSCSSTVTCSNGASTTGLSSTRESVVCLAQTELSLWKSGKMQPGNPTSKSDLTSYGKYSQGVTELWCADFSSWVYKQAGYPIGGGSAWRVAAVAGIEAIGKQDGNFHWHAAGSYVPKAGDLVIHLEGESHVNIVTAVSGNKLTMIGGDQSPAYKDGYPEASKVSEYTVNGFSGVDGISGYVSPD